MISRTKLVVLAVLLATLCLSGCGDDAGPTRESAIPEPGKSSAPGQATTMLAGSGLRPQATAGPTVAEILMNPGAFRGQQVRLMGQVTQPLGPTSFLFNDGTATIPADFPPGPLPAVNDTINIDGTVTAGTGDFAARISVQMWEMPTSFSCDDIIEVRARFSDPGFVAGNVVGYYLAYLGVPAGNKNLEIQWDEGNASGKVDRFELGEGRPRDDGLFDLTGVVGHEYPDVTGTETKKVRANLLLEGREGRCSRVRDVTVDKGSGPGFAAGGALRLSFNDPVPSGGFFSVSPPFRIRRAPRSTPDSSSTRRTARRFARSGPAARRSTTKKPSASSRESGAEALARSSYSTTSRW